MPVTIKNRVYHVKDYETHQILITLNTFGELARYFNTSRALVCQKCNKIAVRNNKPYSLINRINTKCYISSYDTPPRRKQRRLNFKKRK
jgi:hypothetical protein